MLSNDIPRHLVEVEAEPLALGETGQNPYCGSGEFYMIESIMALTVALVISFVMSLISVFTRNTTLGMVSVVLMWVFEMMIVMQIAGFVAEATGMPSAGHLVLVLFIYYHSERCYSALGRSGVHGRTPFFPSAVHRGRQISVAPTVRLCKSGIGQR